MMTLREKGKRLGKLSELDEIEETMRIQVNKARTQFRG